jgi:hypothetical protein
VGYGDFNFETLQTQFDLAVRQLRLFEQAQEIEPSAWLRDTLQRGRSMALYSEKSRSEFIVAPVLLTCKDVLGEDYSIYSGVRLDVDPERGLKGECDFILAKTPPSPALQAPLMVVVEAKKNDIEEGMAQCAAQMIGALLFNESHKHPLKRIHGCITTGEAWQMLRLQGKELLVDADRYYITEVGKVLGVLIAAMTSPA